MSATKQSRTCLQLIVLFLLFGVGCGADGTGQGDANGWTLDPDAGPETSVEPDTTADTTTETGGEGCDGQQHCLTTCQSHVLEDAECDNGEWVCPDDKMPASECSNDGCGGPRPADCVSSCSQTRGQQAVCSSGGAWTCPEEMYRRSKHCPTGGCQVTRSSTNIDGVEIRFPGGCRWPINAVRDGMTIPYEVVVKKEVEGVLPKPTDAGRCQRPGDSGLITSAKIHGDGQRWCRCDEGLCRKPDYEPRTLEPGTYRHEIEWEGHNWSGPSDYGAEKGDLFPPGSYQVTVSGTGERVRPGGETVDYEVTGTLEIELAE